MENYIKSAEDIAGMRVAGRLAAEVLDFITPYVQPGVTTGMLDKLCHDYIVDVQGGIPACLNYAPKGHSPFPKSVCISVNEVACHGIPGDRVLQDGDVLNIDVTVIKDGYYGDTGRMYFAGEPLPLARRLCELAYQCMWVGICMVRPGNRLGDVGFMIEQHANVHGLSVVREYTGHGIGKVFHEPPWVFHCGPLGTREELVPGMTFTIEPIVNTGGREVEVLDDGWTIVTRDRCMSAQWEHTVLVTESGVEILTMSAGTPGFPDFSVPKAPG